jgi:hypothetical protein
VTAIPAPRSVGIDDTGPIPVISGTGMADSGSWRLPADTVTDISAHAGRTRTRNSATRTTTALADTRSHRSVDDSGPHRLVTDTGSQPAATDTGSQPAVTDSGSHRAVSTSGSHRMPRSRRARHSMRR